MDMHHPLSDTHLNGLKGFVCHVIRQLYDLLPTAEPAHRGHIQTVKMEFVHAAHSKLWSNAASLRIHKPKLCRLKVLHM